MNWGQSSLEREGTQLGIDRGQVECKLKKSGGSSTLFSGEHFLSLCVFQNLALLF